MGFLIQLDQAEAIPLASNSGYGDFIAWVRTLPPRRFPELHHLTAYGWVGDVAALAAEAERAPEPPRPDVKQTLAGFRAAVNAHRGAQVATVTDGLEKDA